MFDDPDQYGVPAVHLSARGGALGGDVEQSGPGESADGRAVWIGIRQTHSRFRRDVPTDVERHPHDIGHGDLLGESFGHTATVRRAREVVPAPVAGAQARLLADPPTGAIA